MVEFIDLLWDAKLRVSIESHGVFRLMLDVYDLDLRRGWFLVKKFRPKTMTVLPKRVRDQGFPRVLYD